MPAETVVVDASIVLEVLLQTPTGRSLADRFLGTNSTLYAPHLLDVEVSQVLRRYVLTNQATPRRAGEAIRDLADLTLIRYRHDFLLPRIWELRDNLTAYDATYVALAEVLDARLITRDARLANAPGNRAAIELV